jgi:hypothetical protein
VFEKDLVEAEAKLAKFKAAWQQFEALMEVWLHLEKTVFSWMPWVLYEKLIFFPFFL